MVFGQVVLISEATKGLDVQVTTKANLILSAKLASLKHSW